MRVRGHKPLIEVTLLLATRQIPQLSRHPLVSNIGLQWITTRNIIFILLSHTLPSITTLLCLLWLLLLLFLPLLLLSLLRLRVPSSRPCNSVPDIVICTAMSSSITLGKSSFLTLMVLVVILYGGFIGAAYGRGLPLHGGGVACGDENVQLLRTKMLLVLMLLEPDGRGATAPLVLAHFFTLTLF